MSANHHSSSHPVTGRHPHFAPRQHLTADQLNGIVEDELQRQRRLNIALHGYGVVSGYQLKVDREGKLEVDAKHGIVDISCGLILDRFGRGLYWPGGPLWMRSTVGKRPECDGEYVLRAHYAERRLPGGECWPHRGDRAPWIERSVVFTLMLGCEEHPHGCPEIKPCTTLEDYVCARTGSEPGKVAPAPDLETLCKDPDELCRSECGEWYYDPSGVPVACVSVKKITPDDAKCDPEWGFSPEKLAVCQIRPFVYRNPLLYELIHGCHVDLARVKSLSWQTLLDSAEVAWSEFTEYFKDPFDKFSIEFTKPIRATTLNEGSVFLSAIVEDTDYRLARRIPLRVEHLDVVNGLTSKVRLVPIPNRRGVYDWIEDEIWGEDSELTRGCRIELTIRGHLLRDECGRTLNAIPIDVNPIGDPPKWMGQDQPGDDFFAVFRVRRQQDDELRNQTSNQAS